MAENDRSNDDPTGIKRFRAFMGIFNDFKKAVDRNGKVNEALVRTIERAERNVTEAVDNLAGEMNALSEALDAHSEGLQAHAEAVGVGSDLVEILRNRKRRRS